ncbi:MAG: 14-3-3 family protein [archaeon]|nr:14-3-3 family protein [archaeon]
MSDDDEGGGMSEISDEQQAKFYFHVGNFIRAVDCAKDAINQKKENSSFSLINLFVASAKKCFNLEKEKFYSYDKQVKILEKELNEKRELNQSKKFSERNEKRGKDDMTASIRLKIMKAKDLLNASKEKSYKYVEDVITTSSTLSKAIEKKIEETNDENKLKNYYRMIIYSKKMLGDFYRYRTDVSRYKTDLEESIAAAEKSYLSGEEYFSQVDFLDPYKLSLELNYGVFLYNNKHEADKAIEKYKSIIANISKGESNSKETVQIIEQMDSNIVIWENDTNKKVGQDLVLEGETESDFYK